MSRACRGESSRQHVTDGRDTVGDDVSETTATEAPFALEALCTAFGLSAFERSVLLLCAGFELDGSFASLCAAAQGDSQRAYPTYSLALAALPDAHWSALASGSPLRRWRLLEVGTGTALTLAPLRIAERVLHHLAGVSQREERLAGLVEPLALRSALVPSHAAIATQIVDVLAFAEPPGPPPVVQLCGAKAVDALAIAAEACDRIGCPAHVVSGESIPANPADAEALSRLCEREAALSGSVLIVDGEDVNASETGRRSAIARFLERTLSRVVLVSPERLHKTLHRRTITFDVPRSSADEQRAMWCDVLGSAAASVENDVDRLVGQFDLSVSAACAVAEDAFAAMQPAADGRARATALGTCAVRMRAAVWTNSPSGSTRPPPGTTWCCPPRRPRPSAISRRTSGSARRCTTGGAFAVRAARGLGISALFAGASGTGKTMAAEVLANELQLDLYRIDLSSVVSKYIGETEKNLKRVFDAAEAGGAILLFDEADALFGKRSEVKDSHDRYANIEVSYLLQRMECYRGLAILTTNLRSALDSAFLRRLRFIVQFPFPDSAQRADIWRRIFPAATPVESLDVERLARLNVAGGHIRNIALNAAFLAADVGEPVRMIHLLRAAESEYLKIEKPLTEVETVGWV